MGLSLTGGNWATLSFPLTMLSLQSPQTLPEGQTCPKLIPKRVSVPRSRLHLTPVALWTPVLLWKGRVSTVTSPYGKKDHALYLTPTTSTACSFAASSRCRQDSSVVPNIILGWAEGLESAVIPNSILQSNSTRC